MHLDDIDSEWKETFDQPGRWNWGQAPSESTCTECWISLWQVPEMERLVT